ncbi:MAG TPA: hypothetical protein VH500_25210 [Nitrososphaeraceae archaeon]|jgi:hypothetical protein
MIKTVSICVFLAGIILILIQSNSNNIGLASQNSITSDFFTYVNSTFGIKMQISSDWDLQEVENRLNGPIITIIRLTPAFDIHKSFDTDPSDGSTYIDINLQKNIQNLSLDTLMKNNINTIRNDNNTSDFKLLYSTTDATLAGRKAYTMVYTSTYSGLKTITMNSEALCGNRIYSATFNAEPSSYAELAQTAKIMFGSLRLTTIAAS